MAKARMSSKKSVETKSEAKPDINIDHFVVRRVKALNDEQQKYMDMLRDPNIDLILVHGFAGTSKTLLATCIAAEKLQEGVISKIYVVRPPVSGSKSLGYTKGDDLMKSIGWCMPVLDALEYAVGKDVTNALWEAGAIQPIPLEKIKGRSLRDCFVIIDEAEDIDIREFIACSTRISDNCKMIFSGDVLQCDLKKESGLKKAVELKHKYPHLSWGLIDFNKPEHIVRSKSVKESILMFREEGLM